MEDNIIHSNNHNHNRNHIHNDEWNNNTIEEAVCIADNYGHRIKVLKNRYDSIDVLKEIICDEMMETYSVVYRPANLRLFTLGNVEVGEYDVKDVSSIKIVIVPVVCNSNICASRYSRF
mgnify:CR=1 FL=1